MQRQLTTLSLVFALVAAVVVFAPLSAVMAQAPSFPVTGSGETAVGTAVTFVGTLDIRKFRAQGNQVLAVGRLSGTIRDTPGNLLRTVRNHAVSLPLMGSSAVDIAQVSCDILHLELGPLDLDLLGLVVHLDQIVLDIDAEQGPGNLLGNLLCAIAGLLDPGAGIPAAILADLLNAVLDLLEFLT